jgi:hypothetical protein
MQKVLLSVAAAAALSFASFSASAVTQQGWFVGVNGGSSHYSVSHTSFDDNNDSAFGAVAGYRWVVDRPFSLGVEAGYVDLGKQKANGRTMGDVYTLDYDAKFKGQALLIGANGKWDLPHGWTITARGGFAHTRTKYDETDVYTGCCGTDTYRYHKDSTDNGVYGGLGFGYDFNENVGITLNYDHYALKADDITGDKRTVNVGVFGAAVEYRFW